MTTKRSMKTQDRGSLCITFTAYEKILYGVYKLSYTYIYMILLALWFSSSILVICSAAHILPIRVTISVIPLICTAIVLFVHQMSQDPCLYVPFWASNNRLRTFSETDHVERKNYYVRESVCITCLFWTITLWSVFYTVAASIFSGLLFISVVWVISKSTSTSSSSLPMTNRSDSSPSPTGV